MPLTKEDGQFINYIEQMWIRNAKLPTEKEATSAGFFTTQWRRLIGSSEFAEELYIRNIPQAAVLELQNQVRDRKTLTEKQLAVAAILIDRSDTRPRIKKLKESNVTTQEFQGWLLDPTFATYLEERMNRILRASSFEADYALLSKVAQGDIKAVDYFNAFTGRFDRQVAGKVPEAPLDIKSFLVKVMETLQKHIKDTSILEAIANDLLMHANAQGFASRVMTELEPLDIPIPVGAPRHEIDETVRLALPSAEEELVEASGL